MRSQRETGLMKQVLEKRVAQWPMYSGGNFVVTLTNELTRIHNFDMRTVLHVDGFVDFHVHFPTLTKVGYRLFWVHVAIVGRGEFDLANVFF
jgi:hypothetical protein